MIPGSGRFPWIRDSLFTPVFLGFPCGSAGKESTCNEGDPSMIPGLGRSPGEGKGYPLQYSGLENSMDYTVHGVAESRTRLSDFHFTLMVGRNIMTCIWMEGRTTCFLQFQRGEGYSPGPNNRRVYPRIQ